MKTLHYVVAILVVLSAGSLCAQSTDATPIQPAPAALVPANSDTPDEPMVAPPPVSGMAYPTTFSSEERANYLRGGVVFTSMYSDNVLGSVTANPVSDESYSVAPTVSIEETTPRAHYLIDYAPGFTFYQHISARNVEDQNASIVYQYRLSPHVTFSATDTLQKTSNVFSQPELTPVGVVSGGAQVPNFSVIVPIANQLSNYGNAGLTYQFSRNAMVGISGTFTNLHYPNPTEVVGLYDAASQAASAFYSRRVARKHYVGVTYQYQRLLSYPSIGLSETQTHAVLGFYTVYPSPRLSISVFGGPQRSDTTLGASTGLPAVQGWSPAAGASLGWQARRTSFALSYSHVISSGAGLATAVHIENATGSMRQQITKTLVGSITAGYVQNDILGTALLPGIANGHSLLGSASLQQKIGRHVGVQFGYTWLRQTYSDIPVIAANPVTNQGFISLSYQFERALGR